MEPLFLWNTSATKKSDLNPTDSTMARKFKRACDEISTAYLNGRVTLQEILNETMSEALLVYISEHMPAAMRSALRAPETMQDTLRLALGITTDRAKPISVETQHLASGLFLLVHTKGSVVQCNTSFQPGHATRCANLWHSTYEAIIDCAMTQTKFFVEGDDGFARLAASYATMIKHAVMDWHKGTCVLAHLGQHPDHVDFLIEHMYNDNIMLSMIRLIYCDHAMASMQSVKNMRLMRKLLAKLLSPEPGLGNLKPNLSIALRSLIRAPYVTGRGDLIFAKSIPIDKLTGQPDYVLLCGTSRDLDNSPMRQFTSRKIRHLVHVLIETTRCCHEWSSDACSSFACSSLLASLLDLVTTVEFSERTGKGHIGIECNYFPCQTHQILNVNLMYGDEPVSFLLNCMMGVMVTPANNQGPISIGMDQLTSVTKTPDGFTIRMKPSSREPMHFTTPNAAIQAQCVEGLNNALEGNLVELDIFCSEDWKSNVAEYQQLRLAMVQSLDVLSRVEAALPATVRNTMMTWTEHQPGLSWKLTHICDVIQAMVGMESKRLDALLVSSGALHALLQWYTFNHSNAVCSHITQMLLFYISDPNGKRSRTCPVIGLLMKELPPLILQAVTQHPNESREMVPYVQSLYDAIEACIQSPHSNSHLRVAQLADGDPTWHALYGHFHDRCLERSASGRFKFEAMISEAHMPLQPAFHKDILDLLAQPTFASYDIGSAFLVGNGCVFGYVYKQDPSPPEPVHISVPWRRTLVVFEQSSFKLWCFVPSQHKPNEPINWQWIVPTAVQTHYCQGEDEHHTSIGHHGFDVISDLQHNGTVWRLCTTALHERDEWLKVFQSATATISALASHYAAASPTKPKKKVTNCIMCKAAFHVFKRPYACHRCGLGICGKCSKFFKPIPEMGVYTPVRHCQKCFEASGGAMSESCPVQLMSGLPMIHEDHGHVNDVDRIGGFLEPKAVKPQRGLQKPKMIVIPDDGDVAEMSFPTTPMQVEDVLLPIEMEKEASPRESEVNTAPK
ncbi:hypothetical protein SPRG_06410 [Saprolegnia parasitica CBS 223.65]|uniref:FYVE-type domain-containing protein n=1 Tax=Saprolegnia parasitica (strain CBS 223.65) TaxID=695850 RepID=A0A067CP06_SAPPC|nr:hypothetical protein SPRG_06410 [Saprolegnia parasitica CBS 223.65]KDO28552.1 hypothetical protein SPRG_06410 [Saprolegnia parasitica CBS 223.65]|eukprot:XP_012200617.1 hypothetical protein SPRG_06410 [Saprolegnia parasitica CBS 223.65]